MAHNYSTPDPLRLPSIRTLDVYPPINTNNNTNGSTSVDYVQQQQQQQQYQSQSQIRYSDEYYSHNSSREMGYYGHDPSNTQTAATTTTTSTLTSGPSISQAHSHNNPPSAAGSGSNVSPYRRPRTISSNLSNQIDNNAKFRDPHIHHTSSSAASNNSGSSSIHGANSGSLGTSGATGGAPATATAAASSQTIGNPNQRSSSSSYPASTYSGHLAYSDYYSQRGGGGSGGAGPTATVSTPTTTTATTAAANPAGWYYASHAGQNSPSQSASPPVVATQQKTQPQQQQYSHAASPLQSPVSVPSQQPQQQQYYSQAESMSPYPQQQQQPGSMQSQRTPRSQPMHPPSSSLHASGGLYPGTNSGATSHRGHGHHMAVPSINTSSSSLAGGNGSTSTAVPASSAAPTSTNALIHNLEEDASRAAAEGSHLAKIIEHCQAISKFADHYASQNTNSNETPSPTTTTSSGIGGAAVPGPTSPEYTEMATRADIVLKLVYQLRKEAGIAFGVPGFSGSTASSAAGIGSMMADEMYKKKRSWDDDDSMGVNGEVDALAHQDMALIRSKRAQGGGTSNVPGNSLKSKYKKRSRACPPGKCHSCNTRETPEWRRGPDGARTLCNACGLHYAKLIRKRDKNPGAVDLTPISVEMLRASTRADSAKHLSDIGGSIALSGVGLGSGVPSGNSGGGSGGSTNSGPSGSSASVGSGSSTAGAGTTGSSDMAEITLQPVGGAPSSASTGVTLSPITSNGSLTGPGRSVSNSGGGGGGGGSGMPVHWISPTQHVYRYTGPDSTSSASGNHNNSNNGAGSSYHSHSHSHSHSSHSSHSTHSHSSGTHSYTLPPPPHHHALHLPHPLQRGSNNGYSDGYPASLTRSSASVGGGDGRGSPDI